MAVNRENVVGLARDGHQTESVSLVALHHDGGKRYNRAASIAALAIDESRIGSRY